MTQKELYIKYWKLLDHMEDSVRGDFREHHSEPPRFPESRREKREEETSGAAGSVATAGAENPETPENCIRCPFARLKKTPVGGIGSDNPVVVVVLDPPDHNAEKSGAPLTSEQKEFAGKWFESIGLDPERDIYYTSVIKCRPPGNRPPFPDETAGCLKILRDEISRRKPEAVLAAGETAGRILSGLDVPLPELRKMSHRFMDIFTIVTFPPGAALVNPKLKRPVWEDLKALRKGLDGPGVS